MTLSIIIITKNEAANIVACLESVQFADEIIVVDGASTDGTAQIAQQHGAQVINAPHWPGFGPQKNRALQLATKDWVLSIDADERVTPALAIQIKQAIQNGSVKGDVQAFEIPRLTQFCGQWIKHCGWSPDYVLRLFKRGSAQFSNDMVHERVVFGGAPARLRQPLLHYSYPSPDHYWDKLQRYSVAWAQQRHACGKTSSVARAVTSGLWAFVKSYFFRLGFLDGSMGFVVCTMQAQAAFGKHFHLYYLHQQHASN